MSVLNSKDRKKLPNKDFALPGKRYPVNDKAHARVAKAYASRYASPTEKATIDAKANKVLGRNQAIADNLKKRIGK